MQIFDRDGAKVGPEMVVNTFTYYQQYYPTFAVSDHCYLNTTTNKTCMLVIWFNRNSVDVNITG